MALSIPKLLAKHLGRRKELGFRTMTLVRVVEGTRNPAALSAGTNPTETSYSCKAAVRKRKAYAPASDDATEQRTTFTTVSILAATLQGVSPQAGDRIVDSKDGAVYTITEDGVTTDQVEAMHRCVCMKAG